MNVTKNEPKNLESTKTCCLCSLAKNLIHVPANGKSYCQKHYDEDGIYVVAASKRHANEAK